MKALSTRGFSLVELAVVMVIFGLVLAFSIPAYHSLSRGQQLHTATENIAGQMRLMREVAISNGVTQTMHFTYQYNPGGGMPISDYHIHTNNVMQQNTCWVLPRGITFYWGAGTVSAFNAQSDGRIYDAFGNPLSGMVIVQDVNSNYDTVSVVSSGLILTK